MRITNNMMINRMMTNVGNNLYRMDKTQMQLSTGKKIQVPSDDPVGASKSLRLRTDLNEIQQFKRNLNDSISWLETTEIAMDNIGTILHRARELTVQASNGVYTPEDTQKIKSEIAQLRDSIIQVANTTYAGRSIFTGNKTDKPLLNKDGEYEINIGNNETQLYHVGINDYIGINLTGNQLFGLESGTNDTLNTPTSVTSGSKSQLIAIFDDLSNALENPDGQDIGSYIGRIDKQFENLLSLRGDLGGKMNRLELSLNRLEDNYINTTKLLSHVEDIDMAEVIMNLKNQENIYRASLSGGARIIQPTLMDFIR